MEIPLKVTLPTAGAFFLFRFLEEDLHKTVSGEYVDEESIDKDKLFFNIVTQASILQLFTEKSLPVDSLMTDIAKMRLVYVNANINGEMDFQKVKKLFPPHTLSADGYPFENHVTPEQLAQPMDLPLNAVCALFNTDTLISQMGELNSMQPSEENKLALRQKREILRCYIDTLADHAGEIPMNENVAWNLLQP